MKNIRLLYLFCVFTFCQIIVSGQAQDSVKSYWLDPVEITSSRINLGNTELPVEKDNLSNILGKNGFSLIRKGVFFAQDIYSDGFKKGDINVLVDGERYHSACPNRMDSPITRVNPIELAGVDLIKTSGSLQSGLGGAVEFHRSELGENIKFKGGISGSGAASQSLDAAFLFEGFNNRLNFRYAAGKPYEDAYGRKFNQNYNYKDNADYLLTEASFYGKYKNVKYTASFTYSSDVSFPYLHMDERINRIYNSSISYKENKIYFNYTRHLMNNGLRNSTMFMETDAKNLTVGVVGNFYEVYYRNWDADNQIVMPTMRIENNLIPNLSLISGAVHKIWEINSFLFSVKAGLVYHKLGEENQLEFYKSIYGNSKDNRLFPVFGLAASFITAINNNLSAGLLIETASEAPDLESLFISVKRPMANPNWIGNPELNQAIRATIRTSLYFNKLRLELFGTNVWNYINQSQVTINGKRNVTYTNIDAYMLGFNFEADWKYLNINAVYTFAQNKTNDFPLAEIPPLKISSTVFSPDFYGLTGFLRHTYNDAQTRVDFSLSENSTPAWNKIDLGISYLYNFVLLTLEVENITNELYYQHLSYLRDPFSSGAKVFEPGRTIRLNVKYSNIF